MEASHLLMGLGCDPNYSLITEQSGQWNVRVSPKPNRLDMVAQHSHFVGESRYNMEAVLLWKEHDRLCSRWQPQQHGASGVRIALFSKGEWAGHVSYEDVGRLTHDIRWAAVFPTWDGAKNICAYWERVTAFKTMMFETTDFYAEAKKPRMLTEEEGREELMLAANERQARLDHENAVIGDLADCFDDDVPF